MQEHEYGSYKEQDVPGKPMREHMNGWEFLQWFFSAIGEGIKWAWDEHPFLSLIFAAAFIGLILVLTGHLDGATLWKSIGL